MDLKYVHGDVKAAELDGSISAIITKLRVDRDQERVIPMGMRNYDEYMDNPLIFWAHEWSVNPAAEPIGRATSLQLKPDRILSDGIFAPTQKAQNIRALTQARIVSKTSVGFNPVHVQPSDGGVVDIDIWDLMEWSIVPMPSNIEASVTGVKSVLRWWETQVPENAVNAQAIIHAAEDARLRIEPSRKGVTLWEGKHQLLNLEPRIPAQVEAASNTYVPGFTAKDAADDVSSGALILSLLAELKDEESDDPADAALIQTAIDAMLTWLNAEADEIGSESDQGDATLDEQEAMAAEQERAPVMASSRPKRTLTYHPKH